MNRMNRSSRTIPLIVASVLMMFVVGCAETRSYEVIVKNDSPAPVTVWLYKQGGPYENGWKSPEDLAIESPKADEPINGVIVQPGKTLGAGPIKGKFNSDAIALLRVYGGARKFNELLAIGHGSDAREDIKLEPGTNRFVVTDQSPKLTVSRMHHTAEQ